MQHQTKKDNTNHRSCCQSCCQCNILFRVLGLLCPNWEQQITHHICLTVGLTSSQRVPQFLSSRQEEIRGFPSKLFLFYRALVDLAPGKALGVKSSAATQVVHPEPSATLEEDVDQERRPKTGPLRGLGFDVSFSCARRNLDGCESR